MATDDYLCPGKDGAPDTYVNVEDVPPAEDLPAELVEAYAAFCRAQDVRRAAKRGEIREACAAEEIAGDRYRDLHFAYANALGEKYFRFRYASASYALRRP